MIRRAFERPVSTLLGAAALVVLGAFSLLRLPVSLLPALERPSLLITATAAESAGSAREEMLERVFGLFVQGPQGPDRARGGMGVGLALVKRLTELNDGTVSATSAGTGAGAAFTVRFATVARPTDEPAALTGPP